MSRREGRDSDSKRHRSRFDREPSPKRYRRDGKPEAERKPSNFATDAGDRADHEQKHRRRLQDAVPLEDPLPADQKLESVVVKKEYDKKSNGVSEGAKHSSDPTEVPRSRSYYQHDERGSAGQADRNFGRRSCTDSRSWRNSMRERGRRVSSKGASDDKQQREEKSEALGEENRTWRHDGFFDLEKKETEAKLPPPPPARKRPAFREQKVPVEADTAVKETTEPDKSSHLVRTPLTSQRREDREGRNPRYYERSGGSFARDRVPPSRERYGNGNGNGDGNIHGNGRFQGRERFSGRQGARTGGTHVEKWKHDMFGEANRSPTPKNEEEQIAKVEALLAS